MNLTQVAESINDYCITNYDIADQIASAGYWSGSQEIGLNVVGTQMKLVSHLMVVDGYLRDSEVELYKLIYNHPEYGYEEVKNRVLYHTDTSPHFFAEVPDYLEAAMDFDTDQGTNYSSIIIANLERIGVQVISCDGDLSNEEVGLLSSYMDFLKKIATMRGFEVTLLRDQQEEAVQSHKQEETSQNFKVTGADVNELMTSLNRLVGLDKVKSDVTSLTNLIKVRELRRQQNMAMPPLSMHLVFTGNPGTGKTTVARLLAQIYRSMGILSGGQLIETDRSGLVAGYLGQTAIKVQDVVKQAIGGVLFIDEAYSLTNNERGSDEYGQEAISTLLKLMEDNRDNLVVIAAGYPGKMENFLRSNPGLRSRFNKFIHFDDYSPDELYTIFVHMCQDNGYALSPKASDLAQLLLDTAYKTGNIENGNGRAVRNFFESTITNHANRLATRTSLSIDDLSTIRAQDLPNLLISK